MTGYYIDSSSPQKKDFDVYRRYSQFEELLNKLLNTFPASFFPHLPPKSLASSAVLLDSPEFLDHRTKALDSFMKKLLSHHLVSRQEMDFEVKSFLSKGEVVFVSPRYRNQPNCLQSHRW